MIRVVLMFLWFFLLNPINGWKDKDLYNKEAIKLSKLFKENFMKYGKEVEHLIKSGPII